jgi:hypothetical protein
VTPPAQVFQHRPGACSTSRASAPSTAPASGSMRQTSAASIRGMKPGIRFSPGFYGCVGPLPADVLRYVNTGRLFPPAACANLLRNDKVKSRGLRNLAMERSG